MGKGAKDGKEGKEGEKKRVRGPPANAHALKKPRTAYQVDLPYIFPTSPPHLPHISPTPPLTLTLTLTLTLIRSSAPRPSRWSSHRLGLG